MLKLQKTAFIFLSFLFFHRERTDTTGGQRETEIHRERETGRQTDRQRDREGELERERIHTAGGQITDKKHHNNDRSARDTNASFKCTGDKNVKIYFDILSTLTASSKQKKVQKTLIHYDTDTQTDTLAYS